MSEIDEIQSLLAHPEPAIRYKTRLHLLGDSPATPDLQQLSAQVRTSERIQTLLSCQDGRGFIPGNPYLKYTGAHWILTLLADIGYPPGNPQLRPLHDQVYKKWLDLDHTAERVVDREAKRYKSHPGVPVIRGRARRCASQEGNALWATLKLGIADDRAAQLARNLIRWQWPDGGWNCDRKTDAANSSFHESLLPLRALSLYAHTSSDQNARRSADRAVEIFLKRRLYLRQRDGQFMHEAFTRIHYPAYWHYDFFIGLRVMAEVGRITDPHCTDALDLLESYRLPDGGFPCHRKFYKVVPEPKHAAHWWTGEPPVGRAATHGLPWIHSSCSKRPEG